MSAPPVETRQPSAPVPSPAPRRIATPSWLDLRLVLGVVLVLVAVIVGATVVSRASDTVPVVTTSRDLAAGTTLRAGDLRIEQAQLPDGRSRYLQDLRDAVGRILTRPVSGDELLPAAAVHRAPARTTLTVALAAGAAPQLRTGQRIELWLSTPACAFVVLLPDVTVQSVRSDADGGFADGAGDGQSVVISVPPAQVRRVVAAQSIEDAKVRAGVLSGSAQTPARSDGAAATGSPGAASGTTGLPTDLAACAAADTSR